MTGDRLLTYLNRRPFVPFTIHIADGFRIEVKSPECVVARVVMERGREGVRTIEVFDTNTQRTEIVDLLLVSRLSTGPS